MKKNRKKLPLALLAFAALKEAVYKAIKDHAKTGDSVVIFKDGKVVEVSARKLRLKKPRKEKVSLPPVQG